MKYNYLQLLRFVLATIIICKHKLLVHNIFLDFVLGRAYFGLSIFFIISGFVIANTLFKKPIGFQKYMMRRGLKIYPQWVCSILLFILFLPIENISPFRILINICLLQTFYPPYSMDLNFVGWSLSVELVLYVLIYFIITNTKNYKNFLFYILFFWIVTQTLLLILVNKINLIEEIIPSSYNFIRYYPIWHVSCFLFGIYFCKKKQDISIPKILQNKKSSIIIPILIFIIILLFSYVFYKLGIPNEFQNGLLVPFLGFFILLLVKIEESIYLEREGKINKYLEYYDLLGNISVGMYLFHMPVFYILNKYFLVQKSVGHFFIYYAIVIAFSYISYLVLDKKLHQLVLKK